MKIFQIIDNILINQSFLWSFYIILILLGFVLFTRFWVFIRKSYQFSDNEKNTLSKLNFSKKIVNSMKKRPQMILFPVIYQSFSIVFLPKYWSYFQGIILFFGISIFIGFVLGKVTFLSLSIIIFFMGLIVIFIIDKARKIRQKLVEQFPLFLQGMARSMQAGYSFENALSFVRTEVSDPLRSELYDIESQINLQIPLPKILEDFSQKIGHQEVSFFSESTIIQIKTGGNLVELFQKIGHIINEKLKLERDIRSFTSQGKMSGLLIAGLWPFSLILFWWISPEHVSVLFQTTSGQMLLSVSILLEAIGFYFIWKIVSIRI